MPHSHKPTNHSAILASRRKSFRLVDRPDLIARIPPDLWKLHWALVTPAPKEVAVKLLAGLKQNRAWFPQHRQYLSDHHPPTLILWGPQDGYMPEESGCACFRNLSEAEFHLLDGGHWLLEANLDEVVELVWGFLGRTIAS